MTEKHKIIRDFCDWLSGQGFLYEVLYYGTSNEIDKVIERYLQGDVE